MKGYPNWPNKPKSLSERGYRKFMAKQKKVTVNGEEYTLQSVSPTWYFGVNDDCGMTGGGLCYADFKGMDLAEYQEAVQARILYNEDWSKQRGE